MIRDSTSEEQSDADAEEEEGLLSSAGSITELQAAVQSSSRTPRPGRQRGRLGKLKRGGERYKGILNLFLVISNGDCIRRFLIKGKEK